ncbi:XRE family transcriptional regulator [Streptomyces sp. NPDC058676]|uniref:XRE family transcriptional regulator n=1 Tax=Streptomyces sp. NPDC058676 TaxID=3346593 RepID=UPI00364ADAE1
MAAENETARTDLSDLVRDRMEELDISYRTLASLCIDPENPDEGPLWGRSTLDKLSKGERITPPDYPQLRALAAGLQVALGRVQEAAGSQFLGVDTVWSEDGKVRALVHEFREMDEEDQEKVRALMQSWRKLKRG